MNLESLRRMITVPDWMRFNPTIVNFGHKISLYIPFFLPHHKDYYGFKHLTTATGGLFVDVGANDGISALGFRQVNKSYHILSIEPNQNHEPALYAVKRRMKRFDYKIVGAGSRRGQKILYIPKAAGVSIDTLASLHIDFVKLTSTFYSKNQKITYTKQVVDIIPLDTLKLHPDIIKIDTEGNELDVLHGLRQTIGRYRPCILIESRPSLLSEEKKFFRGFSYSMFTYNYLTDLFSPYTKNIASEKNKNSKHLGNIFCIPTEKIHLLPMLGKN